MTKRNHMKKTISLSGIFLLSVTATIIYAQQLNFTTSSGEDGFISYDQDHIMLYDCNNQSELKPGTSSKAETKIINRMKEAVNIYSILPYDPNGSKNNFTPTKSFLKAIDPGYEIKIQAKLLRDYIFEDKKGKCLAVMKRVSFDFKEVVLKPVNSTSGFKTENTTTNNQPAKNEPPSNGYGSYTFTDGTSCTGDWDNGELTGKASCTFPNGDRYTGEMVKSMKQGKGTLYFANGEKYEGSFYQNLPNGKGTFYYNSGDMYDGYWKDYKYEGHGKYTWKNGSNYEGYFVNNVFEGYGKLLYDSGDLYSGNWKNGLCNGEGILYYKNGDVYTGQWKDNQLHGHGTYTYNGNYYVGYWANNKMNGKVILNKIDGGIVEYEYANGTMLNEKVIKEADKSFEGIGISFDYNAEKEQYMIKKVGDKSPSQASGLLANDILISANGIMFKGKTISEVAALIKGPSGSTVQIAIERNGQYMEKTIRRGKIDSEEFINK